MRVYACIITLDEGWGGWIVSLNWSLTFLYKDKVAALKEYFKNNSVLGLLSVFKTNIELISS